MEPYPFGFLDVGGVLLTNLIFLLYLKNPYSKQRTRDLLLIAVPVALLVLFRRWYAFWGISFYFCPIPGNIPHRRFNAPDRCKTTCHESAEACSGGTCLRRHFFAAPTLAKRILGTDYTDLNSAYRRSENYFQSFEVILQSFGLLYFSLFVLGSIAALINKRTRKFAMFILVQSLVIFVLFARTQDFDSHHRYLLLPTVLLFASLFLVDLFGKIKNLKLSALVGTGLAALCAEFPDSVWPFENRRLEEDIPRGIYEYPAPTAGTQ